MASSGIPCHHIAIPDPVEASYVWMQLLCDSTAALSFDRNPVHGTTRAVMWTSKVPFNILIGPVADNELSQLRPFDEKRILRAIHAHLSQNPTQVSKSRIKKMQQPFWCQYRLRVDRFRVYYDVDDHNLVVTVLRIFEKGRGLTPGEAGDEKN